MSPSLRSVNRGCANAGRTPPLRRARKARRSVAARIAVVDDDEMVATVVALAMRQLGHEASMFASGESLLRDPVVGALDVVLLDLNMPGMSGLECLAQLRDQGLAPDAEIIVLTASHDDEDILRAHWLGASGYVVKPFDIERLVHQLGGFSARDRLTGLDEIHALAREEAPPARTAWA